MSTPRRWKLCRLDDVLLDDEGGVVLRGTELIWLSPLAALLVRHLAEGLETEDQLTAKAVAAFGEPPAPARAGDAVATALRTLCRQGITTT